MSRKTATPETDSLEADTMKNRSKPSRKSAKGITLITDDPGKDIIAGALVVGAFFFGFAGWAAVTPLDAAVVANGSIIVSGNRQAVQHRDGGIVRSLMVREGDVVTAGQVLLELDDAELQAQLASLGSRRIEMEAQKARIQAEESGASELEEPARWASMAPEELALASQVLTRQASELSARRSAEGSRVALLHQQIVEMEARMPGQMREYDALSEQVRLLEEEISGLNMLLAKKLTTVERVRGLERQRADLIGRMGRIESENAQTREAMSRARSEIASLRAQFRASRAEELREVETQLADIAPKHDAISGQIERSLLRAPADGEVVSLTAFTVGGVIQPGAHVMDIVPTGRALVVEATVTPESGDDLRIGGDAKVRFSGLDQRRSETLEGTVTRVSADKIVDPNTGMGFFRVEVAIDGDELAELARSGHGITSELRPGLPAEVIIPTRRRTALQYVVEPLQQSLWRSFRES